MEVQIYILSFNFQTFVLLGFFTNYLGAKTAQHLNTHKVLRFSSGDISFKQAYFKGIFKILFCFYMMSTEEYKDTRVFCG